MRTNLGSLDRLARVVAGFVLTGLASAGSIGAWGYLGIVVLYTGLAGACPIVYVLRRSSHRGDPVAPGGAATTIVPCQGQHVLPASNSVS